MQCISSDNDSENLKTPEEPVYWTRFIWNKALGLLGPVDPAHRPARVIPSEPCSNCLSSEAREIDSAFLDDFFSDEEKKRYGVADEDSAINPPFSPTISNSLADSRQLFSVNGTCSTARTTPNSSTSDLSDLFVHEMASIQAWESVEFEMEDEGFEGSYSESAESEDGESQLEDDEEEEYDTYSGEEDLTAHLVDPIQDSEGLRGASTDPDTTATELKQSVATTEVAAHEKPLEATEPRPRTPLFLYLTPPSSPIYFASPRKPVGFRCDFYDPHDNPVSLAHILTQRRGCIDDSNGDLWPGRMHDLPEVVKVKLSSFCKTGRKSFEIRIKCSCTTMSRAHFAWRAVTSYVSIVQETPYFYEPITELRLSDIEVKRKRNQSFVAKLNFKNAR
ncbi:hypothetical protein H0H81_001480, partial [Sphagnurus paluster]